ncbi:MAG: DUF3396 domain-containing protein [Spirochaetes bacterium]|nr:DUF3396 domain-containing protein [Spirochaetota bacterium]
MSNLNQFRLIKDQCIVVTNCIEVAVYTEKPFFDAGQGVVQFYESFIKFFGKEITFYGTQNLPCVKPINKKALEMVQFWFAHKPWRRAHYGLRLYSGLHETDARLPAFEMFGSTTSRHAGYLRMALPVEIISHGTKKFLDIVREAIGKFQWLSGYAGYSFYWLPRYLSTLKQVGQYIGPKLLRHPGFNMGDPMYFKKFALDSVLGANWLTLLSSKFCDKLGGFDEMKKKVSPKIDIQELEAGILLIAGEKPEIGDINKGKFLPTYQEISNLLLPIRAKKLRPLTGLTSENTLRWLERFDG